MWSWWLFCLGAFGLFGMTWMFPLLAQLGFPRHKAELNPTLGVTALPQYKISILIPAHNEEANLERSIQSIQAALAHARRTHSELQGEIYVGADGCTDGSQEIAHKYGARVLASSEKKGKWQTLLDLVKTSSDSDWIAFVDSGIEWPEDFLTQALLIMSDTSVIAIAPTYRTPDGGRIERTLWSVERHFKTLESRSGGPVSIHGATVFYRKTELNLGLKTLQGTAWLNDDVVIPLTLRTLFPGKRIVYAPNLSVRDQLHAPTLASTHSRREFFRRRRMVLGNVQWIRSVLPGAIENNFSAALLAMRRLFRVFWAYWGLCLGIGATISLLGNQSIVWMVGGILVAILLGGRSRHTLKLLDAAAASLLAPYFLLSARTPERTSWR